MGRRLIAATLAAVSAVLLGVATWLHPASAGIGTHEELGLPECSWPTLMGIPCPTCGMTTAFSYAAHGQLEKSFITQPMGCVLAVATAMMLLVSAYVLATGSRLGERLARLWTWRVGWSFVVAIAAAWVYKIASFRGWL